VVALGLAVFAFELFSGVADSHADKANDKANITMSFLVIVFPPFATSPAWQSICR
jgi:hypothetical protein